jgi:alkanesulfonate monooxygenase SsuD/methylene tetrahydromethanopterin reductase-like flavin-dependent oxidoreductase (luciferase family)
MRVGLFVDLRNPPQWRRPWPEHYQSVLARLTAADELGIDSIWLTEHHLFEDGYLPQPLTFAAALAVRTRRVRLGTAILQAPLRTSIDIAEQSALVDVLSGGRLELGLGAGYRVPEWNAFGVDGTHRYELLEDRAREVRRLWDEGEITPSPVQGRPPIWIGGEGPRAARMAGRLGEGLLALLPALLPVYRESLERSGHDPESARMSGCANLILADDPEHAWSIIRPHLDYQWNSYARYAAEGTAASPEYLDPDRLRTDGLPILPRFAVSTPQDAARVLHEWLDPLPVDHVYFWDSIAAMPDELASRHAELLATELAPLLEVPAEARASRSG